MESWWKPDQWVRLSGRRFLSVWVLVLAGGSGMAFWSGGVFVGQHRISVPATQSTAVTLAVDGKRVPAEMSTTPPRDFFEGLVERPRVSRADIPFRTVRREDRSLAVGEERELQKGAAGIKEITETLRIEDGVEMPSGVVQETVVEPPVDRIVVYGVMGVVSRGAQQYRFVKQMDMIATGYTAGKESNPVGTGYTYTGIRATRGVVAVDPQVIPLFTRLYIEGYGPAVAADIGGAITGDKIDLCFDSVPEALQWGVRPVKVYILGD